MPEEERTYSYEQLAGRLQDVLGVRPSPSSLRAAAAAARRTTSSQGPPRATAQMPPPLPGPAATSPARFDAAQVEAWLSRHPRLLWQQAVADLEQALRSADVDATEAVREARTRGLSWQQITTTLHGTGVDHRSRAGIFKAYRHLDEPRG